MGVEEAEKAELAELELMAFGRSMVLVVAWTPLVAFEFAVASAEEAAKLVQQQPVLARVRFDEELWVVVRLRVRLEQQAGLAEGQEIRPDEKLSEALLELILEQLVLLALKLRPDEELVKALREAKQQRVELMTPGAKQEPEEPIQLVCLAVGL